MLEKNYQNFTKSQSETQTHITVIPNKCTGGDIIFTYVHDT